MNKKLVVLEGISGAGKTTLAKLLKQRENNVDTVNIKISKLLENVEINNYIDYSNTKYYLLLENLKTIIFEDSKKDFVIYERYYLSSLAHAYAMSKMNGMKKNYEDILKWYKTNIGDKIVKPDVYILLEIPTKLSIDRIKNRDDNTIVNDVWIDTEYMEICENYKLKFINKYEKEVPVYRIDGTQKIEKIYNEVIKILKLIHNN